VNDYAEHVAPFLVNVVAAAREYLDAELADDPTVADEGCALHELAVALNAAPPVTATVWRLHGIADRGYSGLDVTLTVDTTAPAVLAAVEAAASANGLVLERVRRA